MTSYLIRAQKAYRQLLADAPDNSDLVTRLGLLTVLEQLTGQSLSALERGELPHREINSLGYALLRAGALELAIDVLSWNVFANPASANAHDSLGEALYWRGEHDAAAEAFRASLRFDNDNNNARRFLRRIKSAAPQASTVPCPRWQREENP